MEDIPQVENDRATALYYVKTFADTAREPILILESNFTVIVANTSFYTNFKVTKEETENKLIYELGNGQWNIPELKGLLENILPYKKVINDFEVSHTFPQIGYKIMILNARQLDSTRQILLAIEDITLKRVVEIKLANYTKELEMGIATKTKELEGRVDELSKLNNIMIGRELKMIELKKDNDRLREQKVTE